MVQRLLTAGGAPLAIDEGESFDMTVTLRDTKDNILDAAAVSTFTLTLFNDTTKAPTIINSRNAQDIQSANGTTISGGVATVRLDALDNVIAGTLDEIHIARIAFTWNDGQRTRTGKEDFRFTVRNLAAPT